MSKSYTGSSHKNDLTAALKSATKAAQDGEQSHVVNWTLEKINGDTGGVAGDVVYVTISASKL